MRKEHGFTLIELFIVIALIAFLASLAVPNFNTFVRNYRLSTQANDLILTTNIARNEAIKRNLNVAACRSADGATCAAAGGWEQGWLIYVDVDTSGTLDAGDEILRIFPQITGGNTLRASAAYATSITYTPRGFATAVGELMLCDDRNDDGDTNDAVDYNRGRVIMINATGRPRTDDATNSAIFADCGT